MFCFVNLINTRFSIGCVLLLIQKRKIQRDQLVRKMREVAGDNLLAQIIKHHRDKNKVRVV